MFKLVRCLRLVTVVFGTAVLAIACGGGSSGSSSSHRAGGGPGSCGVRLFQTPACQQALDSVCCPLSQRCAGDPGCVKVSNCFFSCKGQSKGPAFENCVMGCGQRSRADFCNRACAGQGSGCLATCTKRGSRSEPMVTWLQIADCSKGVNYPTDARCDDYT